MTIIFTLKHKNMTLMASDRRSTESDLSIVPMNEPKIFEGNELFIGAAGTGDICALLIKAFKNKFKYDKVLGYEDSIESFINSVMPTFSRERKIDVILLISFPKVDEVFTVSVGSNSVIVEKVSSDFFVGCGTSVARATFQTLKDTGYMKKIKNKKDFSKFAELILLQTSKYNAGCGDGGDILIF